MKKVTRSEQTETRPETRPPAKRKRHEQPSIMPNFEGILKTHRAAILPDEMAARLLDIQAQFEAIDVQISEASHESIIKRWKSVRAAVIAAPSEENIKAAGADKQKLLSEARERKKLLRVVRANLFGEFAPIIAAIIAAAVSILEAELAVFEKHDRNLAELLSLPYQISTTLNAALFSLDRLREQQFSAQQSPRSALRGIVEL